MVTSYWISFYLKEYIKSLPYVHFIFIWVIILLFKINFPLRVWIRLQSLTMLIQGVIQISSVQFSSVAQSCPTLCNPMNHSTPGFPVHHQLPELTQTHAHRVSDPIRPSHPLSSTFPFASIFPSIRVFSNESVLCIRWPKYWCFSFTISRSSEYSGLISFRIDWFDLLAVRFLAVQGTLKSFSSTTVQKQQFFGSQPSLWSDSHIYAWLLEKL